MVELYRIRQEQVEIMRWELLKPQRETLVATLQQRLPHCVGNLSPEQMHRICDAGIERANSYDMTSIENVFVFIAATLVFGHDFDRARDLAWVDAIFGEPFLEEDVRAGMLIEHARIAASEELSSGAA
jgi:hypothetical protein